MKTILDDAVKQGYPVAIMYKKNGNKLNIVSNVYKFKNGFWTDRVGHAYTSKELEQKYDGCEVLFFDKNKLRYDDSYIEEIFKDNEGKILGSDSTMKGHSHRAPQKKCKFVCPEKMF